MATSGTNSFSLTGGEIVDEAFRLLGVLADGQTLAAEDSDNGLRALNLMVKTASVQDHLWLRMEQTLTLVAGQASYLLPCDVKRVLAVRRRTGGIDTPLTTIGRDDYYDLPYKSSVGVPVSFFPDYRQGMAQMYLWPTPDAGTAVNTALNYTYCRMIQDFTDRTSDPDLPQEWLETLVYNLADRLAVRYAVEPTVAAEVKAQARQLLASLSAFDDEQASVFFSPFGR